jgi:hypothetical protein
MRTGWHNFVLFDVLNNKSRGLIENDLLTFSVEVTVTEYVESKESFSFAMKDLLLSKGSFGQDVMFKFTDPAHNLWAHKAVLYQRSPVFKDKFPPDVLEALNGEIEVDDVEPRVMKELLIHMYTESFSDNTWKQDDAFARKLFTAACLYGFSDARAECELVIGRHVTVENVSALLRLADGSGAKELKKRCVEFALERCPQIFFEARYAGDDALVATMDCSQIEFKTECSASSSSKRRKIDEI